jgi:hypothetical protein
VTALMGRARRAADRIEVIKIGRFAMRQDFFFQPEAFDKWGRRKHGGPLTNVRELEQELWEARGNEYTQPQLGVCLMR